MGGAKKPPLSGEVARRNAGTERLQQICDDLSVSLRLTASLPLLSLRGSSIYEALSTSSVACGDSFPS